MSEQPSQKAMHSGIEFTNLGKINKANIKIRPFTVIAGCNSSGKSFITKSLYSLFSGVVGCSIESVLMGYLDELCSLLDTVTSHSPHSDPTQKDKSLIKLSQQASQLSDFSDEVE